MVSSGVSSGVMVRAWRASRAVALAELLAMLALLLSYIWGWQNLFPGDHLVVISLYFGLCYLSQMRCHENPHSLGLRLDNWRAAVRQVRIPLAIAMGLPLAAGVALGSWHFELARLPLDVPWHVVWGTAQQYGLLCFFYRRSFDVLLNWRAAALAAASAFALLHVPNPLLVPFTLAAGFVSCALYRRVPNVFVLGVAHATISLSLFYALPLSMTHELRVGPGYYLAATGPAHAG